VKIRPARHEWTREMDLSSGRRVKLTWSPFHIKYATCIQAPTGDVRIHTEYLSSGEAWEIRERLKEDPLFSSHHSPFTDPKVVER